MIKVSPSLSRRKFVLGGSLGVMSALFGAPLPCLQSVRYAEQLLSGTAKAASTADPAMWLVWRGMEGDQRIWGANWKPNDYGDSRWYDPEVLGQGAFNSSHAPAVCRNYNVTQGHVVMAWKGSGEDQRIFLTTLAETPTPGNGPVPPVSGPDGLFATIGRPGVASLPGYQDLVLAWQAPDNQLIWSIYDTRISAWSTQRSTGRTTSCGPALVTLGNTVYMFWRPLDDDHIWGARLSGSDWVSMGPIAVAGGAARTSDTPCLLVRGNGLLMAWKGIEGDAQIWLSEWRPGSRWSAPRAAVASSGAILTSHGPALATPAEKDGLTLRLFWKGVADQHIWTSSSSNAHVWSPPVVLNAGINSSAGPAVAGYSIATL